VVGVESQDASNVASTSFFNLSATWHSYPCGRSLPACLTSAVKSPSQIGRQTWTADGLIRDGLSSMPSDIPIKGRRLIDKPLEQAYTFAIAVKHTHEEVRTSWHEAAALHHGNS
jgi:hypothetical protein